MDNKHTGRGSFLKHGLWTSTAGTALAIGLAGATPAAAQAQAKGAVIEEVVVTAQRREQTISQVPISVEAIGGKEMENAGSDTRALSQISPSVTFRPAFAGNSTTFNIRGVNSLSTNAGVQPSTAMIVDGMALYRQGEFIADLADIERIEILKGPQGTLFGKNATGGVVNVVSRRPNDVFEGSVEAGATNDQEVWARGLVNVPLSDAAALRVKAFYRNQHPLIENPSGRDNVRSESYGIAGKLSVDVTPNVNVLLTGVYTHANQGYGEEVDIVASTHRLPNNGPILGDLKRAANGITPSYGNTKINSNLNQFDLSKTKALIGEITWRVNDELTITSLTGYRHHWSNNANDVDSTPAGVKPGVGFLPNPTNFPVMTIDIPLRAPELNEYGSQEIRVNYDGERVQFVGGAYYQAVRSLFKTSTPLIFNGAYLGLPATQFNISTTPNDTRLIDNTSAVFGDVTFSLTEAVSVFGGLRHTWENVKFDYKKTAYSGNILTTYDPVRNVFLAPGTRFAFVAYAKERDLSGRAGVQWRPAEGQNYYVSYNRGYKGPATDGSSAPTQAAGTITSPEIATSYEIGTKQRMLDGRLAWALSVFDMRVKDIQQTALIPNTVTPRLINAGDLISKGAEFEVQYAVNSDLRLSGGAAYLDAKYDSGGLRSPCNTQQTSGLQAGCVNGSQSLTGVRAMGSPTFRYNLALDYVRQLTVVPASMALNVNWIWTGKTFYTADADPLTGEPAYGLLSATATFTSDDGKVEFQVFGRNLTNEFYYGARGAANTLIARVFGYLSRDYTTYGGASIKYKF